MCLCSSLLIANVRFIISDLLLAKYVCQVIQNLTVSNSKEGCGKGKSKPLQSAERFPSTHIMFSHLHSLLVSQLTLTSDLHWCPLAEQAITLVYRLSNQPDRFAEKLLKDLARKTFTNYPQNGGCLEMNEEHTHNVIQTHMLSNSSTVR